MKKFSSTFEVMKHTLVFLAFVFLSINGFSQDIILLKDGTEIEAIVTEIGLDVVKYRKFGNPDGPIYTLLKESIFMIKYKNGTKEMFSKPENAVNPPNTINRNQTSPTTPSSEKTLANKKTKGTITVKDPFFGPLRYYDSNGNRFINNAAVKEELYSVPSALQKFNSGIAIKTIGDILYWSGFIYMVIDVTTYEYDYPVGTLVLNTLIATLPGAILMVWGDETKVSAIKIYNNAIVERQSLGSVELNFGPTKTGNIGFYLNF